MQWAAARYDQGRSDSENDDGDGDGDGDGGAIQHVSATAERDQCKGSSRAVRRHRHSSDDKSGRPDGSIVESAAPSRAGERRGRGAGICVQVL